MINITFTGVDDRTDIERLVSISKAYRPHVEFAILVGSSPRNRFPSPATISTFKRRFVEDGLPAALHLCGTWSRRVNDLNSPKEDFDSSIRDRHLLNLATLFGRVQVNARRYDMRSVERFQLNASVAEVIVQTRARSLEHLDLVPGVSYLHDVSGGRGISAMTTWPPPPDGIRVGYAGGLSAENVARACAIVEGFNARDSWIDMESGVRTDDWFDLDKVQAVIDQVARSTG